MVNHSHFIKNQPENALETFIETVKHLKRNDKIFFIDQTYLRIENGRILYPLEEKKHFKSTW